MKILSISQPFASLIALGLKDIENRLWGTTYRGAVLIHAPLKVDPGCFDGKELLPSAIYRAGGGPTIMEHIPRMKADYLTGGIVGIALLTDCVQKSTSYWFHGPYGFVMERAIPLPFIEMRGQLKLFDPPREKLKEILDALHQIDDQSSVFFPGPWKSK